MTEPMHRTAAEHLAGLERNHRRAQGMVYTPHPLADFVIDRALEGRGDLLGGPVLDPACGAGVFLVAVLPRVADRLNELGMDIKTTGRKRFLSAIKQLVWGLDVDPGAIEIARREVREAIETLSPGPLDTDFMDSNIMVGNFLTDPIERLLPTTPTLVVGNPPYVSTDRLNESAKATYRRTFETAFGRIDLYTLFMEQASRVVAPNGAWALITPDKFLTSESAVRLRELLVGQGSIRSVALFDSHRIFEDAATVPCVTVWDRTQSPTGTVQIDRVAEAAAGGTSPRVAETSTVPAKKLTARQWTFQRNGTTSLVRHMTRGHVTLREVTSRISAGWATGYNPAFVLDAPAASALEPELVQPTVRGRDLRAFGISDRGEYMLVPYTWSEGGASELIELDDFPLAKAWLNEHRDDLTKRHCVRKWDKAWWDLHDPVSLPLHQVPKVLVPDLARSNRFAADHGRFIPQHSAYYLIPDGIDVDILTAILNSPATELLVRTQAPLVKDGFSRYRRQFLIDLPVPEVPGDTCREIRLALDEERHDDLAALTTSLFGVATEDVEQALSTLPGGR